MSVSKELKDKYCPPTECGTGRQNVLLGKMIDEDKFHPTNSVIIANPRNKITTPEGFEVIYDDEVEIAKAYIMTKSQMNRLKKTIPNSVKHGTL